jgi:macrolide transport system ATP-binding/permease protein
MVAAGDGASEAVRKQIESLGTNMVVIVPGAVTTGDCTAGATNWQIATGRRITAKTNPEPRLSACHRMS